MQKKGDLKTITLGCRFNTYETEKARALLSGFDLDADVIFINTCAVTREAERQSKQTVRRAIRDNPAAKVIVTGCATQTSREYFQQLNGIFRIVDNDKKHLPESYISVPHSGQRPVQDEKLFKDRIRAFIQVQNGCDHFCSYCIVPFTRGRSRSLPLNIILDQVEYFARNKFKEIVISGIDITSYGKDLGNISLVELIKAILSTYPEIDRLRLSSVDPAMVDGPLLELFISEKRIMPHLHMSIQAGDNDVLKIMRRRHTREQTIDICNKILERRNDVVLGGDIIAGFPTETASMFRNTLALIDEAKLSLLHVFPYSKRDGTLAAKMPQLPHEVIFERAKILRDKANAAQQKLFNSLIASEIPGIVEKSVGNTIYGKTDSFLRFKSSSGRFQTGDVVYGMHVTGYTADSLITECG
ncbi:MAG: tRNA (N(6)-L-threonylcarbamoyladenosine(37)-C(2))-methylthiotransferase MtaB [Holosporales bacterium]|jgi:threonylcarbamoyladenosine tRNA methylthiotransferase MtaB|nr:tRNA (N(6)-L-threonylcarbamoyladenosine(37)-C(2))-methylthiotransferase MtaB [Holosporales bacterium]